MAKKWKQLEACRSSDDLIKHARANGALVEFTNGGHVKARTEKGSAVWPANRKEIRQGTLRSAIKMLAAILPMIVIGIGILLLDGLK